MWNSCSQDDIIEMPVTGSHFEGGTEQVYSS